MSDLLADDPEWADVVPIRQYENVNPIAPIFYNEECPYGSYPNLRVELTPTRRQGRDRLLPRGRKDGRDERARA